MVGGKRERKKKLGEEPVFRCYVGGSYGRANLVQRERE